MEFLFDSSKVHDISYEHIKQIYLDNKKEERLSNRMTAASYRGENFYDRYENFHYAFCQECLERDPRTAGMRMYYPHGVVVQQAARRNYYRGENQIYEESLPTLLRRLKD